MLGWLFGSSVKKLEEKTEKSFSAVKEDIQSISKWIKHLDEKDKQLFEVIEDVKSSLSSIKYDMEELKQEIEEGVLAGKSKQVFKKLPVLDKQLGVEGVGKAVQTAVQTGNFYDILKGLTSSERLVIVTLANSDMKLSYEDLAMLLGKERATIRGQINSIKQKCELIEEISEKNGKKRVFVSDNVREKLAKYAKVRVGKEKNHPEN